MRRVEKPPLTRAITDFICNALVIFEEVEQVVFNDHYILHLILWEKNIRRQDTGFKYISYDISNIMNAMMVIQIF